jgi:phospholipid/cholesterol/gamma-HCH transport system substrate-binding protein
MRKSLLISLVAIAIAVVFILVRTRISTHRIELKTYFRDAQGLRVGAPVRVAGVDIGSVRSVRVRPELRENAAEVIMDVRTPYKLEIPRDSIASLATAGVFGPTFVEIDVAGASGEVAANGAVLKSRQTETLDTQEFIEKLASILQRKPCNTGTNNGDTDSSAAGHRKSGEKQPVVK